MSNYNKTRDQKTKERLNTYARFSGMGFQMLIIIGLGVFAGVKLDEFYPNQYSVFTIFLSLASIAISLYSVIRQVTRFLNKENSNEQNNK